MYDTAVEKLYGSNLFLLVKARSSGIALGIQSSGKHPEVVDSQRRVSILNTYEEDNILWQ